MAKAIQVSSPEKFLADHPAITLIELLLPDNNGILRGKRITVDKLRSVMADGILLPGSTFGLDSTGSNIEESGLVWEDGDADRICRPVAGSLSPVLWQENLGQMLLAMYEADGNSFFADPRHVLAAIVQMFTDIGLFPVTAMELEFYLVDQQATPDGYPLPPISPATGLREKATQVYGIDALHDYGAFMNDVAAAAKLQNIPADTMVAEYAPGQFEVNLQHVDNAITAADQAILLKRVVKNVARQHAMEATFMAKPFAGQSGNGAHVHVNILDDNGQNIFADETLNDPLRFAIGGLQECMAETMLVVLPNANSYKRLEAGTYAPLAPTWGENNRTVALRIPAGSAQARRIEHRVAGADANPYLVMAAVLAGIHHGLTMKCTPSEMATGNAYEQFPPTLPCFPEAVFAAFDQGRILQRYFGAEFCRVMRTCRQVELARFAKQISPLEHEWYLRIV